MRYSDHIRTRNQTISFWMTPEERRQMNAKIALSGLPKGEYFIRTLLGDTVEIRVGKYRSDRLAVELKKLRTCLEKTKVPEEAVILLLECRALLEEVIKITEKTEEADNGGES